MAHQGTDARVDCHLPVVAGRIAIQVGVYVSYLRGGFWGDWAGGWAFLFRWKVSNPLLITATAVVGLIAFPLLQPSWVMVQ